MKKSAQAGVAAPLILLLAAIGLIGYVVLSSSAPFKNGLFSLLYPKPVSRAAEGGPISKKLFVLIYDPVLSNGQKLSAYKGWQSSDNLTTQAISTLSSITNGKVTYSVAQRVEVNGWPALEDGYVYDEKTYFDVLNGVTPSHQPQMANYLTFVNNYGICDMLNSGQVDELWVFGGPWFGYYESRLIGPGGFWYNSDPITTGTSCKKLLPVMGYNYERGEEVLHGYGHRAESTMTYVYGSWQENRMAHNWDKFGLNRAQSPNYSTFGCGSIHFTPNSSSSSDEYRYDLTSSAMSYCDDFINYPSLGDPQTVAKQITCQAWGCNETGYYKYWMQHLPHFAGTGPDGKLNDWWQYIVDPNIAAPQPTPGTFNNLSATLVSNTATFNFTYSGITNTYHVDMSTLPDMSWAIYVDFGVGNQSPVAVSNPTKWDKYQCGTTLYWRVYNSDRTISSPIQTSVVCATSTPTPIVTATPKPTPTSAPTSTPSPASTGSITGTVYSSVGGPLSGVRISVNFNGSTKSYSTNSQGVFNITGIPAGAYSLNLKKSGYLNQKVNVSVAAGLTVTVNPILVKR